MNIFNVVKEQVTTRQAAEFYGLKANGSGMVKCIFHDDRNPSMKIDRRYHCFGCQADGDVIDLTGKLFGLTPYDAAMKLAADFGISVGEESAGSFVRRAKEQRAGGTAIDLFPAGKLAEKQQENRQEGYRKEQAKNRDRNNEQKKKGPESEEQKREHRIGRLERQIYSWIERAESTLIQYLALLEEWEKKYCPKEAGEELHPLFCETVSRKSIVRYQLDTLLYGTDGDRLDFSGRKERG